MEFKIFPKNKSAVSGIEDKIISLYGRTLTNREINKQIKDLHGIIATAIMTSNITDRIIAYKIGNYLSFNYRGKISFTQISLHTQFLAFLFSKMLSKSLFIPMISSP